MRLIIWKHLRLTFSLILSCLKIFCEIFGTLKSVLLKFVRFYGFAITLLADIEGFRFVLCNIGCRGIISYGYHDPVLIFWWYVGFWLILPVFLGVFLYIWVYMWVSVGFGGAWRF